MEYFPPSQLLLRHDPLADLRHTYGRRPTPLDEVNMWKKRQQLLSSVNDQLDSPVASDILLNLDEASSTYSHSFHNVRKEIGQVLYNINKSLKFKPYWITCTFSFPLLLKWQNGSSIRVCSPSCSSTKCCS